MFRICLSPKIFALLALYAAIEKRERERINFLGYLFLQERGAFYRSALFYCQRLVSGR